MTQLVPKFSVSVLFAFEITSALTARTPTIMAIATIHILLPVFFFIFVLLFFVPYLIFFISNCLPASASLAKTPQ